MKMFSFQENLFILQGEQVYRKSEYSFDFIPENALMLEKFVGKMGTTSLSIGTLQVEISIENRSLLYVWGYHPYFHWKNKRISNVEANFGTITLASNCDLQQGVSLNIANEQDWQTFYDASSGYIVVTKSEDFLTGTNIKTNESCVIELRGGHLFSIALQIKSISGYPLLLTKSNK